ncbi:hypothetical protein [Sphingomonas sp. ABOLD]|uniref:hypothetical protein n=1 Tax=Sphingomonas sp. ABOLD TaxID=1985877 RepID=UPI001F49E0C2|nr:hypothetical protein [Sphingomonas sp. ABOLD]
MTKAFLRTMLAAACLAPLGMPASALAQADATPVPGANPIIRDKFTADPAPLVVGDRLYLYVGHDEAQRDEMFNMREWLLWTPLRMQAVKSGYVGT